MTGGSPHIDLAARCLAGRYLGMAERWLNITLGGQAVAELAGFKGGYRLGSRRSGDRHLTR